jgi:hypothetical protein
MAHGANGIGPIPVGLYTRPMLFVWRPGHISRHGIRQQHMAIRAPLRSPTRTGSPGRFATRGDLAAPIDRSAGLPRGVAHVLPGHAVGPSPCQRPLGRPLPQAHAQCEVGLDQLPPQGMARAEVSTLPQDEAPHLLDLLVWLDAQRAVCSPDIAEGQRETQGTPTGCRECALRPALLAQRQLGRTHRAFAPHEQPIVLLARLIDAREIGKPGPKQGTRRSALVPIFRRPSPACHFPAHHAAHMIQAARGHEALHALTSGGGGTRLAQILIHAPPRAFDHPSASARGTRPYCKRGDSC